MNGDFQNIRMKYVQMVSILNDKNAIIRIIIWITML